MKAALARILSTQDDFSAANEIDSILENFANLTGPFPSYLDAAQTINISNDYSGPWTAGKLYIINGIAEIKTNISNVGIYSTGAIKVDSNLTLQNAFLASEDKIEMGSNIQLGAIPYGSEETPPDPSDCALISGSVFMAARNLIKMGSALSMSGVQIISGGDYEVGLENKIYGAVGVQAAGLIKFGSEEQYQACNTSNEHILIPAGGDMLRLVN